MAKKTESPKEPEPAAPAAVRVRVRAAAIGEGGVTYFAGAEFETTPERAAALGNSVEIV